MKKIDFETFKKNCMGCRHTVVNNLQCSENVCPVWQELPDAMEWVSVKERLPSESGEYLIWTGNFYDIIVFNINSQMWYGHGDYITHWTPLPKPPEVEK